jgi:hypothetical protein
MAARTAVVAGTATAVSGAVRDHHDKKAQQEQEAEAYEQDQAAAAQQPVYAPPPAAVAPAADSTGDMLDQLSKLGQLKADGVLTQAEFDAQKARILA